MAEFSFLLPSGPLSREGGGAYIRNLAAALTHAGVTVWMDGGGPAGSIRVVDGAGLATLATGQVAGAVGLIHHTTPLADPAERAALQEAERERLPMLRRIVATSAAVRDRLVADLGVEPDRVSVVRPGVPDASRSPGSGGNGCHLLSVGALVPRKGHATLLRALARLFDLPWHLTIAGDATRDLDHAAALRNQAAGAGLAGRVTFAGLLDEKALEAEWARADLFALATEWEGYSAPVAEALRRGVPVAVSNGGAAAELVGPEVGVVVHPGDSDGLSKAMRRLVFDRALRGDMADAAWQLGRTLPDWQAQAAYFMEAALA